MASSFFRRLNSVIGLSLVAAVAIIVGSATFASGKVEHSTGNTFYLGFGHKAPFHKLHHS